MKGVSKLWLALVLVLLLITALPLTAPGARVLVGVVDGLPGLEVTYKEGSLAGQLSLSNVAVVQDSISVVLQDVDLSIVYGCLWRSEICLSQFKVRKLLVDIPVAQGDPVNPSPAAPFVFPIAVSSQNVVIDELLVRWPSGEVSSPTISGQVEIADSDIRIINLSSEGTTVQINAQSTTPADSRASIELPALFLPFGLQLENLELRNPGWRFGQIQHRHELLRLSGRWQGSALEISKVTLMSKQWGQLDTAGHINFSDNWPLNFDAAATVEKPPIWAGLHKQDLQFALDGSLAELNIEAEMSGAQTYRLVGSANVLAGDIPFGLSMKVTWPDGLLPGQLPGLGTEFAGIELLAPWVLNASGTLAGQSFTVEGVARGVGYSNMSLRLQAFMEGAKLAVQNLSLHDLDSDSALEVAGEISFSEGLSWNLDLSSTGIEIPALNEAVSGRVQGRLVSRGQTQDARWQLSFDQLNVHGEIAGNPASASGYLSVDSEWQLSKTDLDLDVRQTRVTLFVLDESAPQIDITVDDLGTWLDGAKGSFELSSELADGQRDLEFRGSAQNLEWSGLRVDKGRFEGSYQLSESPKYEGVIVLDLGSFRDASLETLRLSVSGDSTQARMDLATRGDFATQVRVTGMSSPGGWIGQLEPLTLDTSVAQWQLEEPVSLQLQPFEQLSVAAHCWRSGNSRVCPTQLKLGTKGEVSIDTAGDLQVLQRLLPDNLSLTGEGSASIEASWNPGEGLVASAKANMSAGQLARLSSEDSTSALRWDRGTAAIELAGGNTVFNADLWREDRRQLDLEVTLSDAAQQRLHGTLALDAFSVTGTLKPFFPMFSDHSGVLNGKLDFSGSLLKPNVLGLLTLSGGNFSLVGNPTSFEQLELALKAKGDHIDLDGGLIVGGGKTHISGSLLLPGARRDQPQSLAQIELYLTGQEQTVLLPPGIEATVSENLVLFSRAGGKQLDLKGQITVHRGILESEQLPEGSVDISSDVVQIDNRGEVISEQSLFDLIADVNVTIEEAFKVRGTGLETTVGGDLTLRKSSMKPLQLFGQLNIVEGEINAFGQQFEVKRGNLAFVGEPDNPDLNLRAEREISAENVTVGVHLLGNLEAISFNLYSTPVLPEAEMMSYLIRGRGLDQGADADGTAIALSVGMSAINRTGVVRELNKIPGISNVSFGTDGDAGDTTATVSGYLGNRLYLSYGAGIYEPINVLTARLYLQTRLWLEVVSSLQSSADIYYSFDIE